MFFKDDYLRFYQIAAKGINDCKMQIKSCPIELEMDKTYRLSFDIDDYYFDRQSSYVNGADYYFLQCIIYIKDANGNATTKTITVKSNGHYETEFYCNTPSTIEYIRFGSNVYNNMEYRADISNFQLVEIK